MESISRGISPVGGREIAARIAELSGGSPADALGVIEEAVKAEATSKR